MRSLPRICLLLLLCAAQSRASDFASQMMEATFKLFDPSSTATCFLVSRAAPDNALYLVTAAHVLERIKANSAVLVLRRPREDGSYERVDHKLPIRHEGKPLWVRHAKEDAAVLRITGTLPTASRPLPASALADTAALRAAQLHVCSPLFILTFPERFEANHAGFPVARQGIFASPPLLPFATHPTFLADFTTFGGDSGGPVFVQGPQGAPLLVGMVTAQHRHDEKYTSVYEERTVHHPLGLGTVLHGEALRATLDAAAAADH